MKQVIVYFQDFFNSSKEDKSSLLCSSASILKEEFSYISSFNGYA